MNSQQIYDNRSSKSIALSCNPDNVPIPEQSRKSVALSMNSQKIIDERSKKSIALSCNSDNIPEPELSHKSIALSMNPGKIQEDEESKKSVGLSMRSSKLDHSSLRSKCQSEQVSVSEETKKDQFQPFKAKRDQALSGITHTPTSKNSHNSIALSAITHTPTNRTEKESACLSALHLSQRPDSDQLEKSFKSIALSAVKVVESRVVIPPKITTVDRAVTPHVLPQSDKSINPKSEHKSNKSIAAKSIHQEDKSNSPILEFREDKSIGAKSEHKMDQSIGARSVNRADVMLDPKSDKRISRGVEPMSVDEEIKETYSYPSREGIRKHDSMPSRVEMHKSESTPSDYTYYQPKHKPKHKPRHNSRPRPTQGLFKKPTKVDHTCQVVHGRDRSESASSRIIDKNIALDPYLRDESIGAYKRDNEMQYRNSQKTDTDETNNINRRLQVSDDLTIQLNFNKNEKSIKVVPKYGNID